MAIVTFQAKLYTGIRCWCVDKNISAALSSAFTLGNYDIDNSSDVPDLDINGNKIVYPDVYAWRLKRTVADLVVTPQISLTNEKLKTLGAGNVVNDGYFVLGETYKIINIGTNESPNVGDTDWNSISGETRTDVAAVPGVSVARPAWIPGDEFTAQNNGTVPYLNPPAAQDADPNNPDRRNATPKTGKAHLASWTIKSSLTCEFPTYIEFDLEKLNLPEGTDCIVYFEEGFLLEDRGRQLPSGAWEYPDAVQGAPSPKIDNFFQFRTPWYGLSFMTSTFTRNIVPLRIKQLLSSVSSTSSVMAAGVRNPGKLASLVITLFSISTIIGKITRTAAAITSSSTLASITGFLKQLFASIEANFSSTLTSTTSRIRGLISSLVSGAFSVTQNSEQGRIRTTTGALASLANVAVSNIVKYRPAVALVASNATVSLSPIKLVLGAADIIAASAVSATAVKPARYVIQNYTGPVTFNFDGNKNLIIDWGDGTSTNLVGTAYQQTSKTYTDAAQTRTITITGTVTGIKQFAYNWSGGVNNDYAQITTFGELTPTSLGSFAGSSPGITQVPSVLPPSVTSLAEAFSGYLGTGTQFSNWDTSNVTNMYNCFYESNMNVNINNWDTSSVTNMSYMFQGCDYFNQPLNNWDTSSVTNMDGMFRNAGAFNQPINSWNVSNVTSTAGMFSSAFAFNQSLNSWNTGNITDMTLMFENMPFFNGNITSWDVSKVTRMDRMFQNCQAFNQPIGGWNTISLTDIDSMFNGAIAFNQNINSWNVSNVVTMFGVFQDATAFNQPLNNWNMAKVTTTERMFSGATAFNSSLSGWNMPLNTTFNSMFDNATSFNQSIDNWNFAQVTTTYRMFYGATAFNQPLNGWGTKTATIGNMEQMFENATSFNQSLNSWNTSGVYAMSSMFRNANAFNGSIGSWNTSFVNRMDYMFDGADSFNQPIGSWNVSNVTTMTAMFNDAYAFNQPIGTWNVFKVTQMSAMFRGAASFDQDLGSWNLYYNTSSGVGPGMSLFFHSSYSTPGTVCGISQANYDKTMIGWANYAWANKLLYAGVRYRGRPEQVAFGRKSSITGSSTTYGTGQFTTGAAAQTFLATDYRFAPPTGGDGARWTITAG